MTLLAAIDISNGTAVQLRQGVDHVLSVGDPFPLVKNLSRTCQVVLTDLDAARGTGENLLLMKRLLSLAPCWVGGGIRSQRLGQELLAAGANKIIIGTKAVPSFLKQFESDQVIAAIDDRGGKLTDHGWTRILEESPIERAMSIERYVSNFIFTDVEREGTLLGADMAKFKYIASQLNKPVIVAGGICNEQEIIDLDECGVDCLVGLALHNGCVDPVEVFVGCVKFDLATKLAPAIVQDRSNLIRMLGYVNSESLRLTLRTGRACFWSRRHERLWTKGETSGNFLDLDMARLDCDRDSVLFTVDARGGTCHRGSYSCFGHNQFDLKSLERRIAERIRENSEDSYTVQLVGDVDLLKRKIVEESGELVQANSSNDVVDEAADLIYHLIVFLQANSVSLGRVEDKLAARRVPIDSRTTPKNGINLNTSD